VKTTHASGHRPDYDTSGSMGGDKLTAAKAAANTFIGYLNSATDRVAYVEFKSWATLQVPLTTDFAAVKRPSTQLCPLPNRHRGRH